MCGRFQFSTEQNSTLAAMAQKLRTAENWRQGEIFPAQKAPVLVWENTSVQVKLFAWGFPGVEKGKLIINARAETAARKPMFRACLATGRCVIPAAGFYEWDAAKHKYFFHMPGQGALYMAALYRVWEGDTRFCILTTQANASVRDIHVRMPLVLAESNVRTWLEKDADAQELLEKVPPPLQKEECGGQLKMW